MSKLRKLTLSEENIVAGYKNGLTLQELSAQFSASPGTIRATLLRHGVTLRHRGRRNSKNENL